MDIRHKHNQPIIKRLTKLKCNSINECISKPASRNLHRQHLSGYNDSLISKPYIDTISILFMSSLLPITYISVKMKAIIYYINKRYKKL